jgi:hypothetical protein
MVGLENTFKGIPDNFFGQVGKHACAVLLAKSDVADSVKLRAVDEAFAIIWEDSKIGIFCVFGY